MGTAIRHRVSEAASLALSVLLALATAGAEESAPAAESVRPGTAREALVARFGAALREVRVEPVRSLHERIRDTGEPEDAGGSADGAFAGQRRLAHTPESDDVQEVEYDLFRDRVYRVRWRLDERFERPLMEAAVAHLTRRLGAPAYDQTLRAKLGSGKADLRRAGWRRAETALELRQLSPLAGGPLYLTLSRVPTLEAIVAGGAVVLPQPETVEAWWRRRPRQPALLTPLEHEHLRAALDELVERIGFAPASD